MHYDAHMKTSLGVIAGIVILAGCGGGGGSTPPINIPATGQSALVTAAEGAILYQGAQADAAPAILSTNRTPGPSLAGSLYAWVGEYAVGAFSQTREPSSWTPIPGTAFYFKAGPTTLTSTSILLSTNGTGNNAGYITLSLESIPARYPMIIGEKSQIILPSQTITGSGTLSVLDNSGKDFTQTVSESAAPSGVSVTLNLTEHAGSVTSEAFAVTHGTLTVTFSGLTGSSSGYTAGLSVGSISGGIAANADGSGSAWTKDAAGTWSLTWNANMDATLTAPNGTITSGSLPNLPL